MDTGVANIWLMSRQCPLDLPCPALPWGLGDHTSEYGSLPAKISSETPEGLLGEQKEDLEQDGSERRSPTITHLGSYGTRKLFKSNVADVQQRGQLTLPGGL